MKKEEHMKIIELFEQLNEEGKKLVILQTEILAASESAPQLPLDSPD